MSSTDDQSNPRAAKAVPVVNLPNALTVFRICLVPVFIWFYLMDTVAFTWAALGVFMLAAFTDQLDGHIARSQNLITDFGRLADPLADKALTLAAFILLSIRGPLPYFWIFTVLVAIREVGITFLREVLRRHGTVVAASSGGKIKTVLQMGLITFMLVPWGSFISSESTLNGIVWGLGIWALVTLAVTLWSGAQYCWATWSASVERD